MADRHRREDLAVECDAVLFKGCDERAVALESVVAYCGIEADNPELARVVLLVAAVGKCLLAGVYERLVCSALFLGAAMAVALGALQDVAAGFC